MLRRHFLSSLLAIPGVSLASRTFGRVGATRQTTGKSEQWREDLRFLAGELPRLHLNAFHRISPEEFQRAISELDAAIPTLPDHVIITRMTAIVASVGDAHTALDWTRGTQPFRRYPLVLRIFKNQVYVTAIGALGRDGTRGRQSYARALGARVTHIGNLEIESAGQRMAELVSTENDAWLKFRITDFLITPEFLHALGIIKDPENGSFTFTGAEGKSFDLIITPASRTANIPGLSAPFMARIPTPLARTRPASQFYWFEYLENARTLYFQYNRCAEMPTLPFASFLPQLLAALDSHPVVKLVVDLRQNTGGNSAILVPFINAVRARGALNRSGNLFVAIDNGTISSGMLNAVNFLTQTQATFVGEPTGGKPNSYGEVRSFTLPNSNLNVSYAIRFFQTLPGDPPSVIPNLPVEMSIDDLLAGRDPVLESILALP